MLCHVVGDVTTHAGFTTTWLVGLPPSGCLVVRPWINCCPKATLKLVCVCVCLCVCVRCLAPSAVTRLTVCSRKSCSSLHGRLAKHVEVSALRERSGEACDNDNVVALLSAWCCVLTFRAFVHAHTSSLAGKVCSLLQLLASSSHVSSPPPPPSRKHSHICIVTSRTSTVNVIATTGMAAK